MMFDPEILIVGELGFSVNFYPFSIMHPLWELRTGALCHYEKLMRHFPKAKLIFDGRSLQRAAFAARHQVPMDRTIDPGRSILILAGNVLPTTDSLKALRQSYEEAVRDAEVSVVIFLSKNTPIGAYIPADIAQQHHESLTLDNLVALSHPVFQAAQRVETTAVCFHYLWEIFDFLGEAIQDDFQWFPRTVPADLLSRSDITLIEADAMSIAADVQIDPYTVLDARTGPIIIESGVRIMAHSYIQGPAYLGPRCLVKPGTQLLGNTAFGEHSKVAGEVEESVIHAFSNKQHLGFLGHSYLCEWVNFGAGTNVSNLKNNYGIIKVQLENTKLATGRMFLGVLCGDHTKTSINTQINSGTLIGICCNIFTTGFPEKFIPSFSWGGHADAPLYYVTSAIATAKTVMARRNRTLLPEEEVILRKEYERVAQRHYAG